MAKPKGDVHKAGRDVKAVILQMFAVISLLLVVTISPVLFLSANPEFFKDSFINRDTYIGSVTSEEQSSDYDRFSEIIAVMHGTKPELDPAYFSVADQIHMQDVARLTLQSKLIVATSALYLATYLYSLNQNLLNKLKQIASMALGLLAVFAVLLTLYFDQLFIIFHQIFFSTNTFWVLDPATSRVIRFLPQSVFEQVTFTSGLITLLSLFLLIAFAIIAQRWKRNEK